MVAEEERVLCSPSSRLPPVSFTEAAVGMAMCIELVDGEVTVFVPAAETVKVL
jgi:hypothetical protein